MVCSKQWWCVWTTGVVLIWVTLAGCGLQYSGKPWQMLDETSVPETPPAQAPLTTDKAVVSTHIEVSGPPTLLVHLRCQPDTCTAQNTTQFVSVIHSMDEVLANIPKDKIPHTAVVVFRLITAVVNEQEQERYVADLIPVPVFLSIRDSVGPAQLESVQHILQFFALTMPAEMFVYLVYQNSMPQLDPPEVYTQNWALMHDYLLTIGIQKKWWGSEELKQELLKLNMSAEIISKLQPYVPVEGSIPPNKTLTVVFVSPWQCQYTAQMSMVLPPVAQLREWMSKRVNQPESGKVLTELRGYVQEMIKRIPVK